ncbi:MAG: thiamine diphosphokinase [Ruminococcus sp.]|nr:thiamine diphosphokinase [Ruminococcus sp.]
MKRCIIFGALPVEKLTVQPTPDDLIIAADNGYAVAQSLGVTPDITVGDFDSLGEVPKADNLIKLDVRKNDTDLEHAVTVALDKGCDDFVIYGAVGGKLDHTLGNIAVAERIALAGAKSLFIGGDSSFTVIRNTSFELPARDGGRLSVFSLSEISRGVEISGLAYEVTNFELSRTVTRGVSNAFIGKPSRISVSDGTLLIVFDT